MFAICKLGIMNFENTLCCLAFYDDHYYYLVPERIESRSCRQYQQGSHHPYGVKTASLKHTD